MSIHTTASQYKYTTVYNMGTPGKAMGKVTWYNQIELNLSITGG